MKRLPAIAVLALAAAACGAAPTVTPAPSSPAPAATPATVEPSAGRDTMELVASSEALAPGRYTRTGFRPPVTFEVEGPWFAVQLFDGFFDVQQDVGSPDVIAVQFATPDTLYGADGAAVELTDTGTAAAILGENPRLSVVETSGSRIGGLDGHQVTVENTGSADAQVMHVPPGPLTILPGRRLWIAFFDTPDGILAIMVGGSVAAWDDALLTAEPVLESILIGEPG